MRHDELVLALVLADEKRHVLLVQLVEAGLSEAGLEEKASVRCEGGGEATNHHFFRAHTFP